MKAYFFLLFLFLIEGCNHNFANKKFNCYNEAINILFKNRVMDTLFVASNFPDFNINTGKLPDEIFDYYESLDRNQDNYSQIRPDSIYWIKMIFNKNKLNQAKKINKSTIIAGFTYSFNMKLGEGPNLSRTYLTFSPIYYNSDKKNGFFIVSEINNRNLGITTVFFVDWSVDKFIIKDKAIIHRFMPN